VKEIKQHNDEISLKELLIKSKEIWRFLVRKRKIIILAGLLGACIGLAVAWLTKPKYIATLTFSVENEKTNPLGAYSGLASMAGIDLGGSGGSMFSSDNIMSIMTSRKMTFNTLLSPITIDNRKTTLIDYYLTFNHYKDKWAHKPKLAKLKFGLNLKPDSLTRLQDSILFEIHKILLKKVISITKPDKKLSLIEATCTSTDELFSKVFVETLSTQVTAFYIGIKTKRQKENVDILQNKADSLYRVLSNSMYKSATLADQNLNMAKQVAGVDRQRKQIDQQVASTAYTEIIKNLEMAKITLQKETPLIQVIDQPVLPLEKEKVSKLISMIVGGILSCFLVIGFLLGQKLFKKIMAEDI
jgi:hypothetical protein